MGNNRKLQFAIRAALAAAAAASVVPVALAQTATTTTTTPANDTALQEVVVTGSRIQSLNLNSISPVSTVTAVDIQATGLSRVEDILNNLPMVFAGQNSTVSNGSDGTATVDLRGLGAKRTLVLVDGRRLGPGQGSGTSSSDINQIPVALIERVDILTGGASSVYGADAVSGVVNFVLNTHFQGVKIDASYDFNQHSQHAGVAAAAVTAAGDLQPPNSVNTGFGKNVSVLMGSNFADDRGNATFYATYDETAPVLQAKYDHSACVLDATKTGALKCGGSATSARNGAGGYFQAYGTAPGPALFTNTVDGLTGQFRPYTNDDLYNFGPVNFFQRPNTRWTAGSFVDYQINDHLTAYAETMFTRNTSAAQIAASGDFGNTSFIPCNDPLLTAQEAASLCSPANLTAQGNPTQQVVGLGLVPGINTFIARRNVEGGGRIASFQSDANRILVGLKGEIVANWKFDVSAQRSTVDNNLANLNYFSNANIQNALTVVPGPGGVPTCASVLNGTDTSCVPWNIWSPNGVTKAATDYLSIPLLVNATTTEELVTGSITGDLGGYGLKIPMADEGVKVSFGAEWRSESAQTSPDLESQLGNAAGSGGPTVPVAGGFTVKEIFTEIGVPIATHQPFADSIALDLGYRYSDYSEGFKTNTYKVGFEWAPISDFRFRGSYARAVRAPNVLELFTPQAIGLDGTTDPCSGAVVAGTNHLASGATAAQCALMGVAAAQFGFIGPNPAGQYFGNIGGNPQLQPEKSDTYSVGVVLQPHWIENFTASVDWFDIKVNNTIGGIGADVILKNCIATGDPALCGAVHRDANGSIWKSPQGFVNDVDVNFGSLSTKGLDIKMNYHVGLPAAGSIAFGLEGTRLISLDTQPLTGGPEYDCTNLWGTICGAPSPSWRHVFNTTWSTPWSGLDVTMRWRYIGKANSELTSSDPQLSGKALPQTSHIPAYNYIDLTARLNLYKQISLQLGVNNVTDKDPPIIDSGGGGFSSNCNAISSGPTGSSCNGNTFPGTYDALGRFFFARVTAQF